MESTLAAGCGMSISELPLHALRAERVQLAEPVRVDAPGVLGVLGPSRDTTTLGADEPRLGPELVAHRPRS
jgi:hypothetical protein